MDIRLTPEQIRNFRIDIYAHYATHPRPLPWRFSDDPYRIFVSEIMLQQTQVERVVPKYEAFLGRFPDFPSLAGAPLQDVVLAWQGLGYNRRALYLQRAAQIIVRDFGGMLPDDPEILETLPGIGHATAREIAAFAFRREVVFIETNIRRVFIHLFFGDREGVHDRDILPLVEETLDRSDPRTWYYALMDYGVMLKRQGPNPNLRSAHYQKQIRFEGSNRQLRGAILKIVAETNGIETRDIITRSGASQEMVEKNLQRMMEEGLLKERDGRYTVG